ncbi:MAG: hypothetical protein UV82_C0007G0020 [Candidatus Magasanikbacteria bacterium GW2011_GWD2_43_18]|nr:MAG: hypothetical protein UV18_C0009G0026 [Candidatus Magasanikbacteria bacterium GW2011_GWC2_42_27]KKT04520.1 MAG: hypothetical protein UV82_C0007G0020 [Candidatus Magasanikbacteria bacterium GW2011_GWD2_43_18]HCC13779.1 hypothetical protein [Candidatus Magasanikbacteria bacterium]
MALAKKIWKASRFHKGISNLNADGSFWFSNGLDIDQYPPYIKVSNKFFKETDSVLLPALDEPWGMAYFNNRYYMANRNNGKIFENTFSSWVEVHDNVNIWGGSGMFADEDYLYYAGSTWIGRYDKTTWTDSWQSLNVNTAFDPVPITKFLKFICFGNKQYMAAWDTAASSWNPNRLTLPSGYVIRWLAPLTDYLVVSAHHESQGSALFFWDGYSQTYNRVLQLTQTECLSGVVDKNVLYMVMRDGWICRFNGTGIEKLNRFPDMDYQDYINILAQCVKVYQGMIYIAKGSNTFETTRRHHFCGIWVFNPATNALYYKHRFSNNAVNNHTGGVSSVQFLFVDRNTIRVGYRDSTKYIVDINHDTGTYRPYDFGAYWVSPLVDDEPYLRKRFKQAILNFMKPIPNSSFARFEVKYNTSERWVRDMKSVNSGGSDFCILSSFPTGMEVGDEVIVTTGGAAGQTRHIKAMDTVTKRIDFDETLYYVGGSIGTMSAGDMVMITPFKKLGTIKGNENSGKVNKMIRFNARTKKIQFKVEIWSNSGFGGEWDMGLKDFSAIFVPDRIIK